jgi:dienelactone hydrolase
MKRTSQKGAAILLPIIVVVLLIGTSALSIAADIITFKGSDTTAAGSPLVLTGKLTKPQGNGPFPSVVLLHGCGGFRAYQDVWAVKLASWGYVALQVDSFGPRGKSSICEDPDLLSIIPKRAQDAYDAKSYLLGLPYVDRNRIAVMGWSHGGITTLSVVDQKRDDPFRSAIAFYPYCNRMLFDFNAPLLILIGEKDIWTPASACSMRMRSGQIGNEVTLKIYPDSHHGFDGEELDTIVAGYRLLYNPVAAADAIIQVKAFLAKHLK